MHMKTRNIILLAAGGALAYWWLTGRVKQANTAGPVEGCRTCPNGMSGATVSIEQGTGLAGAPIRIENVGLSGRFVEWR